MDFNDDWGLMYVRNVPGRGSGQQERFYTVHRGCPSDVHEWTPIRGPQLEIGYDNVEIPAYQRRQQASTKITLAQQWQAGGSVWSRPAIRIFATLRESGMKNWGYSNTSGLQTKDGSGSGAFTSSHVVTTAKLPSVPRWKCGGNTVRRTGVT